MSLITNNEKKEEKKTENVTFIPKQEIVKKDKYYIATYALLYYMLVDKRCLKYYDEGKINFPNEEERFLASEISYYYQKYGIITPADFYTYLSNRQNLLATLDKVMELDLDEQVEEKVILDYINTLRLFQTNREIKRLEKILKEENDIMIQASIAQKIAKLKQEI